MPDFAVWLPGNAARPERFGPPVFAKVQNVDWSDLNGLPGSAGGSLTYRLWRRAAVGFVFSFSTSVLTSGRRVKPVAAFVLFATTGATQITGLTLTDGGEQVVNINPFQPVSGSHPNRLEPNITMFDVTPFYISFPDPPFPTNGGLVFGLAMQVWVSAGDQDGEITFVSVGVDLNLV